MSRRPAPYPCRRPAPGSGSQRGRLYEIPILLFALALFASVALSAYKAGGWHRLGLRCLQMAVIVAAIPLFFMGLDAIARAWAALRARGGRWERLFRAILWAVDLGFELAWRLLLSGFLTMVLDGFLYVAIPASDRAVDLVAAAEGVVLLVGSYWHLRWTRRKTRTAQAGASLPPLS